MTHRLTLVLLPLWLLACNTGPETLPLASKDGGGGGGASLLVEVEGYRAQGAFIAGTDTITWADPARCSLYQGELAPYGWRWSSPGHRRLYMGVFSRQPIMEEGLITNPEDVVWAWNTGDGRADKGEIYWHEGFSPDARGLPDLSSDPPTDLAAGVYWAVIWAWDEDRLIAASSETRPFFYAPDDGFTVVDCCEVSEESNGAPIEFWCYPDELLGPTGECSQRTGTCG